MKVKRSAALNLFHALGVKSVDNLENLRLAKRLVNVPKTFADKAESLEGDDKELYDTLTVAVEENDDVVVTGGKPDKPSKPSKEDKEDSEEKPKREKVAKDLDRYGMRLGSGASKINTVVSIKPKSTKQIHEEVLELGVETSLSRVHGHMRKLLEKGFVKKTDEGWVDALGVKAKKPKK